MKTTPEEARKKIRDLLNEAYEIAHEQRWKRSMRLSDEFSITIDTAAPPPKPGTPRTPKDT